MAGDKGNLLELLRKAIELAMPDMRHYYRMVRKARVVASYACDGAYFVDVQPLLNNETDDPNEPVVPKIALPVIWGGPQRGIVCPPEAGSLCDLAYYDGDPNYPVISNIRWQTANPDAPTADLREFVIQLENGVEIRIDKDKNFISLTPADWKVEIGGNAEIKAGGNAQIEAAGTITLTAPMIAQNGNVTTNGASGGTGMVTETVDRIQNGALFVNGPVTIDGPLTVSGGITGRVEGCSGCRGD